MNVKTIFLLIVRLEDFDSFGVVEYFCATHKVGRDGPVGRVCARMRHVGSSNRSDGSVYTRLAPDMGRREVSLPTGRGGEPFPREERNSEPHSRSKSSKICGAHVKVS